MINAVQATVESNQVIWGNDNIFSASYTLFKNKIPEILQSLDLQQSVTTGAAAEKTAARTILTDKTLFIANRIQSYATTNNLNDLLEQVTFTHTDLTRAKDSDLIAISDNIYNLANQYANALESFAITSTVLIDLQAATANFTRVISKPRDAQIKRKNATANLEALIREAINILTTRVDLDVKVYKDTNPDFYNQYMIAREIVSRGITSLAVTGSVTDKTTAQPIEHVEFTFTPDHNGNEMKASVKGNRVISKKSAAKGKFQIPSIPEGQYNVTISKLGYKDQVITIYVIDNETTKIDVQLEKL